MKQIRIGIIGAGWVAREHLNVIRAIDWIDAVGITSRTKSKAEELAHEFVINVCTDTIDSLIKECKPDALLVLVSEDQMVQIVLQAMEYKIPLFIEKPAGLTPQENYRLAEEAEKYNIKTMVGFNRRYYSIFHKGIDIIKRHGTLKGIAIEGHERMWRIREGGKFNEDIMEKWIYANSSHTIDLLRFFGGDPLKVNSIAHRRNDEVLGDQFASVLQMDSGAIGQYSAFWYSPGGWKVVLYGEGVTVEFKPLEKGVWIDKNFSTHEIEPDQVDKHYKCGFYKQMEAFGKLVSDNIAKWPMLDLFGAYKTMKLIEEISLKDQK